MMRNAPLRIGGQAAAGALHLHRGPRYGLPAFGRRHIAAHAHGRRGPPACACAPRASQHQADQQQDINE
ncbi:MAG: hypothetical protein WKG07_30935 [Hymenobacter sp.]